MQVFNIVFIKYVCHLLMKQNCSNMGQHLANLGPWRLQMVRKDQYHYLGIATDSLNGYKSSNIHCCIL